MTEFELINSGGIVGLMVEPLPVTDITLIGANPSNGGGGSGDMLKSTYDTDNDGIVDDSKKLGGQLPAYYQSAESGKGLSQENYTTVEKSKLSSITEIFTTALKTAYDSAVTWISINGTALISHLSNTSNPHSVTKSQVGLSNVPNLAFSGSNTGDETTGTIQTKRPLKTVGGISLEGAGDIPISGGGSDITIAHIIALG